MWMMCESGSKDDCDILFLYHGNLFFDEVEEIDGGEPEKEDESFAIQKDYDHEKEDMALEIEGIEEGELEQDVEVEAEEKKEEIPSKDEEIIRSKDEEVKKQEKAEGVEKKDHGGTRPKTVNVQTVPVQFNTHRRSARKEEKDEIEKEVEKNIQQ